MTARQAGLPNYSDSCFHTNADYILSISLSRVRLLYCPHQSLVRRLVVEPSSLRGSAADCLLLRCLGFDLATSTHFFLLSPPSRLRLFHRCVVVCVALRVPSISKDYFSNRFCGTDTALLLACVSAYSKTGK